MDDLISELVAFRDARGWGRFHTPENLARALSVEAAELLECFQWGKPLRPVDAHNEVADVLIYALLFCSAVGIDPADAVRAKVSMNEIKYPVDEWRDRAW